MVCTMVQLMPLPPNHLVSLKSRMVVPLWCRLTQVVLEKRPLDEVSGVDT